MVRLWSPTCLWCWRIPLLTLHLWLARLGQRFLPTTIEHHEFASLSALSDSKIFWFEIVFVFVPASADHPIWRKTQRSAPWSSFSCRFPLQPPPCLGLDPYIFVAVINLPMFDICMKFLNILQQIYLKPINENQILRQISKTTFCSREKTEQSVDVTRTHWKKRVRIIFLGKARL